MFMLTGHGHGSYGGQKWTARAGDAVLMDLRIPHTYYSDPGDPWEMYWVRMGGPGVDELFSRLIETAGSPVIPFASRARIDADIQAIFDLHGPQTPGYKAWIFHHLTGLVANVTEGLRRRDDSAGETLPRASGGIAAATALLRAEHAGTVSLRELARAAHMSIFHFSRRFKAATGFSPMDYLEKFRISRAQELILSDPDMKLKQIASETGYADAAYFSRVFKKCTGVSPREYRKALGKL